MSKVTFIHKDGREQVMPRRYAEILNKVGRGTYMTRDMTAAPPSQPTIPTPLVGTPSREAGGPDLDAMELAELHALARDRGVKVHHKAGADKVRAALREAAE
ncbi:hypothetical protein [Achromobacter sp. ACRQX]|uniref:hypothetical protein n=1 Tax=Achromobacter sp. ACRQX TaxID=2918181 RepID=UPI001EF26F10|nr:hypothetical protein [Achromobacter sp. ACRQX]MCG7328051.1 hypothetical protein [Achromobacter sp. ACRQX]